MGYKIVSFYHFGDFSDQPLKVIKKKFTNLGRSLQLRGTMLLAKEGVNATIAGDAVAVDGYMSQLQQQLPLDTMTIKVSYAKQKPFYRFKIKLKKEIVTLGQDTGNVAAQTGTKLNAAEWNKLLTTQELKVIDTRNNYETAIGTFAGSIDPQTTNFRDFAQWVADNFTEEDKKNPVAMFCTGGIRCEKASHYMLQQGFSKVYQLDGGILSYLDEVSPVENKFVGECFVFDYRISVNKDLQQGQYLQCHACRYPLSVADRQHEYYHAGISCPYCYDKLTPEQRRRFAERSKQMILARMRGTNHLGGE